MEVTLTKKNVVREAMRGITKQVNGVAGNLRGMIKGARDHIYKALVRSRLIYWGVPLAACGLVTVKELEEM